MQSIPTPLLELLTTLFRVTNFNSNALNFHQVTCTLLVFHMINFMCTGRE